MNVESVQKEIVKCLWNINNAVKYTLATKSKMSSKIKKAEDSKVLRRPYYQEFTLCLRYDHLNILRNMKISQLKLLIKYTGLHII